MALDLSQKGTYACPDIRNFLPGAVVEKVSLETLVSIPCWLSRETGLDFYELWL